MKNFNKKIIYSIVIVIVVVLIILVAFVFSDKKLDLESEQVASLYKYLGEVDVYHCGGLSTYSDDEIVKKDLSNGNTLCMAYYALSADKIKNDVAEISDINKNDIKTCKVGESTTLAVKDGEDQCDYIVFNKDDLNDSYRDIYGVSIEHYDKFYISSTEACFLEGENYYCGTSETFTYSLAPEATIYRLINKAVKKLNGDIVIYDYFLKISGNVCYPMNDSSDENKDCTKAFKELKNEINVEFVKKYGSIYKHTFESNSDNYYWIRSDLK